MVSEVINLAQHSIWKMTNVTFVAKMARNGGNVHYAGKT